MVKATRRTIPQLVQSQTAFVNSSGTLKGMVNPMIGNIHFGQLNHEEQARFRVDEEVNGLAYVIVSYETPIAWVTKTGWTYKVRQTFTQTTSKHQGLLYLLKEGHHEG